MDEMKGHEGSLATITIVSSPLLLAGLGFGVGVFITAPDISGAFQMIGTLVFCVATGVTAWLRRKDGPTAAGTGFGALYGAIAILGYVCGGHAAAFIATGNLNPLGMFFMGLMMYGLSGAFLGAIGGFVIGAGVWLVERIQSARR